jgi:glycosyltransferase involved in cell wall biosynthesis
MKKSLRIVQLIDSLHPGGAERMALNLANGLVTEIEFSGLMVTREEGGLHQLVENETPYLFLKRNSVLDLKALKKAVVWLKENQVDIIHAHGTSLFFAVLCKLWFHKIKIIWHDHHGNRNKTNAFKKGYFSLIQLFVSKVFVVNNNIKNWISKLFFLKSVFVVPNFVVQSQLNIDLHLKGEDGKRMICVANFRDPKNHQFLIEVFNESKIFKNGWTLHLIGNVSDEDYFQKLTTKIHQLNLSNYVLIYQGQIDVASYIKACDVGVLTSTFEGFPVTLLEYGLNGVLVIASNVGNNAEIISNGNEGWVIPLDLTQFAKKISEVTNDKIEQKTMKQSFNQKVLQKYERGVVINQYIDLYNH